LDGGSGGAYIHIYIHRHICHEALPPVGVSITPLPWRRTPPPVGESLAEESDENNDATTIVKSWGSDAAAAPTLIVGDAITSCRIARRPGVVVLNRVLFTLD
jgi:hypothetical protein